MSNKRRKSSTEECKEYNFGRVAEEQKRTERGKETNCEAELPHLVDSAVGATSEPCCMSDPMVNQKLLARLN